MLNDHIYWKIRCRIYSLKFIRKNGILMECTENILLTSPWFHVDCQSSLIVNKLCLECQYTPDQTLTKHGNKIWTTAVRTKILMWEENIILSFVNKRDNIKCSVLWAQWCHGIFFTGSSCFKMHYYYLCKVNSS